jgi:NSS family neurotransmitter:Na+ symporter
MGCFVAFCTAAIMFYYSVVTGWALRYLAGSLTGAVWRTEGDAFWAGFHASGWQPVLFHGVAIFATAWIVSKGVVRGIERANRILVPSLVLLLGVAAVKAMTLPGSATGLNYLFEPDFARLTDYRVWLEGLSQSAWSTGAGWGLILTYAVYMRSREDIALNSFLCGLGNNSASLLAAMAILPTVFALAPSPEAARDVLASGNEGLAFIWIPNLFRSMPLGRVFLPLFFLALSLAAVSSLLSMLELVTRVLGDFGVSRRRGIAIVACAAFLFGLPSALSLDFFKNQDWTWGLGLMVSGAFFSFAAIRFGIERIRRDIVNAEGCDLRIGRWFSVVLAFLIPIEFVGLIAWWFAQAIREYDPAGWWQPFRTFSVGTCVFQWGVAIALFAVFNRSIASRVLGKEGG